MASNTSSTHGMRYFPAELSSSTQESAESSHALQVPRPVNATSETYLRNLQATADAATSSGNEEDDGGFSKLEPQEHAVDRGQLASFEPQVPEFARELAGMWEPCKAPKTLDDIKHDILIMGTSITSSRGAQYELSLESDEVHAAGVRFTVNSEDRLCAVDPTGTITKYRRFTLPWPYMIKKLNGPWCVFRGSCGFLQYPILTIEGFRWSWRGFGPEFGFLKHQVVNSKPAAFVYKYRVHMTRDGILFLMGPYKTWIELARLPEATTETAETESFMLRM